MFDEHWHTAPTCIGTPDGWMSTISESQVLMHIMGFRPNLVFKIAGVTFEGRQTQISEILQATTPAPYASTRIASDVLKKLVVLLREEPSNDFDPNAIEVLISSPTNQAAESTTSSGMRKVGYIPRNFVCRCCGIQATPSKHEKAWDLTKPCSYCGERKCGIPSINQLVKKAIQQNLLGRIGVIWIGSTEHNGVSGVGIGLEIGNYEFREAWYHFSLEHLFTTNGTLDERNERKKTYENKLLEIGDPIKRLVLQ